MMNIRLFIFFIILLNSKLLIASQYGSISGNIILDPGLDGLNTVTISSDGDLGIGGMSSGNKLHLAGNASVLGMLSANKLKYKKNYRDFQTISSNTTLGDYSLTFVDTSSGNITLKLPYAGNVEGQIMSIKQISTGNSVTLQSPGSTIDGRSLLVSTGNSLGYISLISSANQWHTLSSSSDWNQETIQSISGLSMWYDAADLDGDGTEEGAQESGYSTATGGNIVQWKDKSGNNYHLSGNGTYPTPGFHQETQNGRSVVTNTSGNMLVYGGGVPDMDGWSVFVVFKPTAWPGVDYYIFSCDELRNKFTYTSTGNISTINTSNRNFFSSSEILETNGIAANGMTLNAYNLLYAEAHSSHAARNVFLFLNRKTCDRGAVGSIAEVIFYNRTLSNDERKLVEGYLKYKWNLSTLVD